MREKLGIMFIVLGLSLGMAGVAELLLPEPVSKVLAPLVIIVSPLTLLLVTWWLDRYRSGKDHPGHTSLLQRLLAFLRRIGGRLAILARRVAYVVWFLATLGGLLLLLALVGGSVWTWLVKGGLGLHTILNLWMPFGGLFLLAALVFLFMGGELGLFSLSHESMGQRVVGTILIVIGLFLTQWIYTNLGPYPDYWVQWLYQEGLLLVLVAFFAVGVLDRFVPKSAEQSANAVAAQ